MKIKHLVSLIAVSALIGAANVQAAGSKSGAKSKHHAGSKSALQVSKSKNTTAARKLATGKRRKHNLVVNKPTVAARKLAPGEYRKHGLIVKKPTQFRLPSNANFWCSPEDSLSCITGFAKGPEASDRDSRKGKSASGAPLRYASPIKQVGVVALPKCSKNKQNNYAHGTAVIFRDNAGRTTIGVDVDRGGAVDKGKAARKRGRTFAEKNALTIDYNSPRAAWKNLPDFTVAKVFRWKCPVAFKDLRGDVQEAVIDQARYLLATAAPSPRRLATRR